jgi:hypothetical protein
MRKAFWWVVDTLNTIADVIFIIVFCLAIVCIVKPEIKTNIDREALTYKMETQYGWENINLDKEGGLWMYEADITAGAEKYHCVGSFDAGFDHMEQITMTVYTTVMDENVEIANWTKGHEFRYTPAGVLLGYGITKDLVF